jgi:N4-(beta-N-acetylglucosaminyl)-L-asparaginase
MYDRRKFIKVSAAGASLAALSQSALAKADFISNDNGYPIVISTWNFGVAANQEAWKTLSTGGRSLDAV